jgi:hypothetical protein
MQYYAGQMGERSTMIVTGLIGKHCDMEQASCHLLQRSFMEPLLRARPWERSGEQSKTELTKLKKLICSLGEADNSQISQTCLYQIDMAVP